MPKALNFDYVSKPAQGTSVQEQALDMMGKPGGVAKPLASQFVRAVLEGLDRKDSPKQTRIDTLTAIMDADKTDHQSIARAAGIALYGIAPRNQKAKEMVLNAC